MSLKNLDFYESYWPDIFRFLWIYDSSMDLYFSVRISIGGKSMVSVKQRQFSNLSPSYGGLCRTNPFLRFFLCQIPTRNKQTQQLSKKTSLPPPHCMQVPLFHQNWDFAAPGPFSKTLFHYHHHHLRLCPWQMWRCSHVSLNAYLMSLYFMSLNFSPWRTYANVWLPLASFGTFASICRHP